MCHAVQTTEEALATRLLQATIHTLERLMYRWSIVHCLPVDGGFFRLYRLRAQ
jgi:hypothetical protein